MDKKVKIIICVILIVVVIGFIGFAIGKKSKKEENNIVESVENSDITRFEDKMTNFEERLLEEGIELTSKEVITSEALNESGYKYNFNGDNIELYNISQEKMENIMHKQNSDYEFVILTRNHEKVEVIYYDEILIMNCAKNRVRLLETLEKLD